ncbi:MAG: ABC transporter ATP-binding protein [Candidatus Bathyarchaeia archaeon]
MRIDDTASIEARDLVKVYRTGGVRFEALRGVSLRIERGELVSILGPSGSGKSTLLNMIGLLDRPSSGKVLIEGRDTSRIDEDSLATLRNRRIGFVFQAFNLIHRLNSLENIELPLVPQGIDPERRRSAAARILEMVGLSSKAFNKPDELSGGEQQRVAIARALVTNPAIVLGDEPTGNVDSKTAMQLMEIVRDINKRFGTTFVLVTHNPDVAAITHRRIILRDGQVEREERN